jgi:hypothetical protein
VGERFFMKATFRNQKIRDVFPVLEHQLGTAAVAVQFVPVKLVAVLQEVFQVCIVCQVKPFTK